jgi:hypothetical protein
MYCPPSSVKFIASISLRILAAIRKQGIKFSAEYFGGDFIAETFLVRRLRYEAQRNSGGILKMLGNDKKTTHMVGRKALPTLHQSKLSVTAPFEAELTNFAYFANTPRV